MKLFGRILVILIVMMSFVYLVFSVVLYASHKNWKDDATKLEEKIKTASSERDKLKTQKEELIRTIDEEKDAYQRTIAALKSKSSELTTENTSLLAKNSTLESDLRKRVDVITANNVAINEFKSTILTLTKDLAATQSSRSDYLRDLALTIGDIHEQAAKIGDAQKKNEDLKEDVNKAMTVLDMKNLTPTPELYDRIPAFPVKATIKKVKDSASMLVVISQGSDEGLKPKHLLEVSRGSVYLGKLEVVEVDPHEAVCKILPKYQQGEIKEGDSVSGKFN